MKLEIDSETLAEKKALILYILDKVSKPISNEALLKLTLSIDNMNYFYFQQFLLDLLDNKYIINYTKNEESFFKKNKNPKFGFDESEINELFDILKEIDGRQSVQNIEHDFRNH